MDFRDDEDSILNDCANTYTGTYSHCSYFLAGTPSHILGRQYSKHTHNDSYYSRREDYLLFPKDQRGVSLRLDKVLEQFVSSSSYFHN